MEVYGRFSQKVRINPQNVIEKLIEDEVGSGGWIFEKDEKYYRGFELSAGCHSFDRSEEIDKGNYEYILALQLVLKTLKNKE